MGCRQRCVLVLPDPIFSATGAGLVAGVVLVFALLQDAGLRALTRNRCGKTTARSAFENTQRVEAPPAVVWDLVRDLEGIGRFSSALESVEVTGHRVGARRTFENQSGRRWSEDVIEWDDSARTLTLQFDAEAPDVPLPVGGDVGGMVRGGGGRSRRRNRLVRVHGPRRTARRNGGAARRPPIPEHDGDRHLQHGSRSTADSRCNGSHITSTQ